MSARELIVDLFAGPGGWSEGLRALGPSDVGLEMDDATCRTRAAAGHDTIRADVAAYPTAPFVGRTWGLIASPPCQEFSSAHGRRSGLDSSKGQLVWQVQRWAEALEPEWIACEQVPAVLPVWQTIARSLTGAGYFARAFMVNAADYGLAQDRRRAVLLASRDHFGYTVPTHHENVGMFGGERWRTLAEEIDLEPGWFYDSGQMSKMAGGTKERYVRSCDRPSGTVTGQTRSQWVLKSPDGERRKLTVDESARLQGFRDGYPWQGLTGEVDQQIGNAIPPVLASHLLSAVSGVPINALEVAA